MKKFFLAALAAFALITPLSAGAGQLSGATIKANQVFLLDFFNFRIRKVEWMPAAKPLVQAAYADDAAGSGAIVLTIELRNASGDARGLPDPVIQVIQRDGTQTTAEARTAYTPGGKQIDGDYQPGDGPTVRFVIPNISKPTASNPITKIVFTPSYTGDTGPAIFRFYNPVVVISP
ncbi:MAG: hypothetical protein M3N19_11720 [Candidatus Eremiobacteraeota bacterium]|nr:hypothetical protein [Candidatus Eremiobacteraeota bacterium]